MSELESKALDEFTKFLRTNSTKKHYMSHLRKYLKWSDYSTYDELINRDIEIIQAELENYVTELQKEQGHANSYMKLAFSGIGLFYIMNNKMINKIRISKMIWPDQDIHKLEAYTTYDIQRILDAIDRSKLKKHPKFRITRPRLRAAVHFLASTGCRIGGLTSAKVKDLRRIENCYAVTVYPNSQEEYVTFLTPEASKVLDEWLDFMRIHLKIPIGNDEFLDFDDYPLIDMNHFVLTNALSRVVRKANLNYEKNGKRYPKPLNHAYRYRFNTIAKSNKNVNPVLVERLLGHSTSITLDKHYLKPTTEVLFEEYKKLIKDLTIN